MLSTQQPHSCTGWEHNEIVIALQYRVRHKVHLHCCTKANNTVTAQCTVPGSPIARGRNLGRGAVRISSAFLTTYRANFLGIITMTTRRHTHILFSGILNKMQTVRKIGFGFRSHGGT